ncbi:MAG: sulfite exporter TauE/SafE family protein [Proteobacteria bacterium]|nr:sulfite exporter TauE/SafE family protein [Pseudomonadota bacterium]
MTLPPLYLLLVALVGVFAGTVNTIAGGGSLITLPALIFLGIPPTLANGTNRVGVVVQSMTAAETYRRRGILDAKRAVWPFVPLGIGSVVGAWFSTRLDDDLFRMVIAVAMLAMLAALVVNPKRWLTGRPGAEPQPWYLRVPAFLVVGLYGGFLHAGVGVFLLAALVLLEGHDLLRGNAVKVLLVGLITLVSLGVFVYADLVAWDVGLCLAAGSGLGGWLGSKLTVSWGPTLIRWVLIAVVVFSSARLLGLF